MEQFYAHNFHLISNKMYKINFLLYLKHDVTTYHEKYALILLNSEKLRSLHLIVKLFQCCQMFNLRSERLILQRRILCRK